MERLCKTIPHTDERLVTFVDITNLLKYHSTHASCPEPDRTFLRQPTLFGIAGGLLTIYNHHPQAVYWSFDGGAGGTHGGYWHTLEDCREWLAANADAILDAKEGAA